jgi:hypothetical protein
MKQITRRHTPQITYEYRLLQTEVRDGLVPIDYTISFSNTLPEIMFPFTRRPISLQLQCVKMFNSKRICKSG